MKKSIISNDLIEESLHQYINENYKQILKPYLVQKDGTKKKYTEETAIKEIKSIKLIISEGINPKREIYLKTKDQREVPLTRVGEPLLLSQIEEEAVELASFLGVPLEGL